MRASEHWRETDARPLLHVYRGDEAEAAAGTLDPDDEPSPPWSEAEIEAFWAGRKPAARFSARVAA